MRLLLLAVCLVLTACASTSKSDNYIRTTGIGNTYEEAKHNAFKEAIEYQVGVVIASERESYNENLIKNDILAYSSAFVDDYKIISQQTMGNKVQVVVDVKLSLLKLSDRILSKGKDSKNFDGAKHDTQYKSFIENKQNGDRIFASILNDYPKRAYTIKQHPYNIKIDSYRNLKLSIPYEMRWDSNYVAALHDAIKVVSDGKFSYLEKNGMGKKYPAALSISNDSYYFNDSVILEKTVNAVLNGNEPRINVEIKDTEHKTQYSKCVMPKMLNHNLARYYSVTTTYTRGINIHSTANEMSEVEINIHQTSKLANAMNNSFTLELSIVPKKLCAPDA